MGNGGEEAALPRVEVNGAAGSLATTGALALGERGAGADEGVLAGDGVEPVVQGIGRLMVALSELLDAPAMNGMVRIGALELDYQALHRAHGSVRARWLTGPESATAEGVHASSDGSGRAGSETGMDIDHRTWAWERGVAAAREGEYTGALRLYEQEAEAAVGEGEYGRAAIAYRSASGQAERVGRHDAANRLLRLAGKHYLHAAESPDIAPRGIRQAYEVAAKCFLQAGNLELASTSISRAMALDEALGAS